MIEALDKSLRSPIGWVSNQALIALISGPALAHAVGHDLTTELVYDLAGQCCPASGLTARRLASSEIDAPGGGSGSPSSSKC